MMLSDGEIREALAGTRPVAECWSLALEFAQRAVMEGREAFQHDNKALPEAADPAVQALAKNYMNMLDELGLVGL